MTTTQRTLYRGGLVYSPEPFANAMLVDGDTIAWVGADEAADSYVDVADEVIDLNGAFVAPGFVDSHVHLTSTGLTLTGIDLTSARSVADLVSALAECSDQHVIGHGWDDTHWDRPPTRHDLDAVAADRFVYLSRIDVHSAVVSTALLHAIDGVEALPGFREDGRVSQEAHHAVRRVALVDIPDDLRERAIRASLAEAARHGIVSVHECGGPDIGGVRDFQLVVDISRETDVCEIVPYWGELGAIEAMHELGAFGLAGDLFVDGSIGSHTACLASTYLDADTSGVAYLDTADIADHIVLCTKAGVQAGFHVIGDEAISRVANALSLAAQSASVEQLRHASHRLEHVELLSPENLAVFGQFNVLLSMQPVFDELWGGDGGLYDVRLGRTRMQMMNPFGDIARAGVPLSFSSDAPVTPLGPWRAIKAAVEHRTPGQRISARAAFNAHTRGGRRAAKQDGVGALVAGERACFSIWRTDDLEIAVPDDRVSAWSTDPRAGVSPLPSLANALPHCVHTVRDGVTIFGGNA